MNSSSTFEFFVRPEQKGTRLDLFLSLITELDVSRSHVKKLIEDGQVTVNGQAAEPSYKIKNDDRVKIVIPPPPENATLPENIPLNIIFEDNDVIVINKPKGLVVHPAPGNRSGTLVNALLAHCDHLATVGAPLRPGIVHRLDKDTSGVLVVAKTDQAYRSLIKQIKDRTVEKTYLALVHGTLKNNSGIIDARIGRHPVQRMKMAVIERTGGKSQGSRGRDALTTYKVIKRAAKYSLLEVKIKTGRTHQIRVHLSHLGHPVVGDQTYGKKRDEFNAAGQLLHAYKLSFNHPTTGERVEFKAEMPDEMKRIVQMTA
ncbi:MAG: RluA family pseudouridine synthase [Candidatus Margulisbacteria bacterium]|nr:RluA family pseudouridine synthase [Candidatus Margulisiibacteriota bacterium]